MAPDSGVLGEFETLLLLAQSRIEELNEKYASDGPDPFFLLHRARRWNERERLWMGYERKRGKLADLNLLLREPAQAGFSLVVGPTDVSHAESTTSVAFKRQALISRG